MSLTDLILLFLMEFMYNMNIDIKEQWINRNWVIFEIYVSQNKPFIIIIIYIYTVIIITNKI